MKIEAARFVAQPGMSKMGHPAHLRCRCLLTEPGHDGGNANLLARFAGGFLARIATPCPEAGHEKERENETDCSARLHVFLLGRSGERGDRSAPLANIQSTIYLGSSFVMERSDLRPREFEAGDAWSGRKLR